MKTTIRFCLVFLGATGLAVAQFAPTPVTLQQSLAPVASQPTTAGPAGTVDILAEVDKVTADLKAKFDAGQTNAAELKENQEAITSLIMKHRVDGKRDQVARLYLLNAHIFADALGDAPKARAIWMYVAKNYYGTPAATGAGVSIAKLDAKLAAGGPANVTEGLEIGQRFPGINEADLNGQALNLAAHRGRVTMIDFWATWCPPCRGEMPNVIATYQKYNPEGFDIIGVSLDDDHDALVNFLQAHGMTWQQYFDGQGWDNKLAKQYNVHSIPMDYLLDRHGIIIGKELRGEDLPAAVEKALEAKD